MKKYPLLFFVSLVVYTLHFIITKHGIYGDGNGYFALAHTLFFKRNLDFAPIYAHLSEFKGASYTFSRVFWDTSKTATGLLNWPWFAGTALFWLPFFIIIYIVGVLVGGVSPYHGAYEYGCGIAGITLMLAGLALIEKLLSDRFSKKTAATSIFLLFFGSQIFYYSSFEPALSHQVAFFLVCLYLFLTDKYHPSDKKSILTALPLGLLAITRPGDIVLYAPFVLRTIIHWIRFKRINYLIFFLLIGLLMLVPQVILQYFLYASPFQNPYILGEKGVFAWEGIGSLFIHMFSLRGGLLLWSPVLIFSIAGLIKSNNRLSIFSLITYAVFIAFWEPTVPEGFGNRFYISAFPLIAFGTAYILNKYPQKTKQIMIFSFFWNVLLLCFFYAIQP